jgi:hypothetical protein
VKFQKSFVVDADVVEGKSTIYRAGRDEDKAKETA